MLAALGSDAQAGLSQDEAGRRLERYGQNELASERPTPTWKKILAQFADPLVVLLLVATAISAGLWLLERKSALPYEAIAILDGVAGIRFCRCTDIDVVRHPIVQEIIKAYERFEKRDQE